MLWPIFREPVSAWTHLLGLLVAIPATWFLWRRAPGRILERVAVLVFGLGMVVCYAGSGLYHSVPARIARPYQLLDHVGIYLMIAGTVTPIGLIVLTGWWRTGLVGGIWLLAMVGIALRLTRDFSPAVLTGLYLFMGWVGCATYYELAARLSHSRLRPLWIGGVLYSIGAVLNGLHWPVIVPGVFEAHEVFHLFVMAGSACHYYFILSAVLPYRESLMTVVEVGVERAEESGVMESSEVLDVV